MVLFVHFIFSLFGQENPNPEITGHHALLVVYFVEQAARSGPPPQQLKLLLVCRETSSHCCWGGPKRHSQSDIPSPNPIGGFETRIAPSPQEATHHRAIAPTRFNS